MLVDATPRDVSAFVASKCQNQEITIFHNAISILNNISTS